jgi:hypothetical protein
VSLSCCNQKAQGWRAWPSWRRAPGALQRRRRSRLRSGYGAPPLQQQSRRAPSCRWRRPTPSAAAAAARAVQPATKPAVPQPAPRRGTCSVSSAAAPRAPALQQLAGRPWLRRRRATAAQQPAAARPQGRTENARRCSGGTGGTWSRRKPRSCPVWSLPPSMSWSMESGWARGLGLLSIAFYTLALLCN